jgi:hypothetical protein
MKLKTCLATVVVLLISISITGCGLSSSKPGASSSNPSDKERTPNSSPEKPKSDESWKAADYVNWANAEGAIDVRNWIKKQPPPSVCKAVAPPENRIPDTVKRNLIDDPKLTKRLMDGLAPVLKLFNCENSDGLLLYKGSRNFAGTLEGGKIALTADKEYYSLPYESDRGKLGILRLILAREMFNQILPVESWRSRRALKLDCLAALASLELDNNPEILALSRNDIINNNTGQTEYYPIGLLGGLDEYMGLSDLFVAVRREWDERNKRK